MGARVEADREFWSRVLAEGGTTTVPRWVREPVPGAAEHEAAVPDDVAETVRGLVRELGVPVSALLLAAHAKVLATLSGEPEVVTGYAAGVRGEPLPCRLAVPPGSWRALVSAAQHAEAQVLAHREFPVDELRRELGAAEPSYEVVFGPRGAEDTHADDGVVHVRWSDRDGRLRLRLRYRTDVLDAAGAARIGDYHVAALGLMTADLDAEHTRQSLLSADEVREQLEGLAGPRRPLPDARAHELFEQRARAHPDAVAAVQGEREWTYGELNARANRLARALLQRGLGREDVVAVVTERDLDWLAATLAVFKAGGAYLPIEPHFPADRITATLSRAGCRLVLTASGSTRTLDRALAAVPGTEKLLIETAYAEPHSEADLGVRVDADQLAYIYFTSGSTGEPKGAMCEHAGLLNHLYAKIDDLGIDEGCVVAQTAPQCFDISLWQLVSSLLTGGRTLLVAQDVIVDVERFVDTLVHGRVGVAQVVPSYLEVVVSYLEQRPRALPDLRCVSVTGEALKRELVQRWFAIQPEIKLVNAYGLTETSDDTNHEVMDAVPERVLLGRAVNNVHVYVVDEQLSLVPLGAPGLIAFSGVCVGRGYVNDPERTREAYRKDPYRPGQRLYLGGDWGRWHPGGKLEFLGRRDNQVKIRGFRIEIGEIENALLRVAGVRDGAVVVADRPGQNKHLIAFYTGRCLEAHELREALGAGLPAYMVPSAFHWQPGLPLTANGKIDRKALTALAETTEPAVPSADGDAPLTPTERKLAVVWADLLGVPEPQIGRKDHFFDSGGTSLTAVRLTVALDRAVSLKDITRHPVLADLAGLLDGTARQRTELLQPLSEADGAPECALVCFPYAGGNAVNYQPMASALAGSGVAVLAVDLPGHDLAAHQEPFASITQVAEQVASEIVARGLTRVLLWGHSSGTAPAIETARRLQAHGVDVPRVFLGAQLLGTVPDRRSAIGELTSLSNAEIAARLTADNGYTELAELNARHAEHIGAAYRHDCVSAHRYFCAVLENPAPVKLAAPVSVVVAADDPHTAGHAQHHRDWLLLTEHVDLHELTDGGHYFPRTRPAAAAQAVLGVVAPLASS
ncbi:amino acid adenylation domain-containing protein [Streptomyces griseochromogenes]|uniref:Amino acid adenylation domain-containing protein n=1 Tax=Streptomyces griseochromogenes TaxID=68214 RepID=A0A1B1AY76_9ACTN|nr:non-ribosomal peptide synthetase [Streptomyces griseochromogenes]ANP51472.1 non-ribosomal peptide synthetase [Streptomyces griseochromogenes]MBP2049767.1 amino acid adenylation domain-containing protein [Streptomyces griseochromogenes]